MTRRSSELEVEFRILKLGCWGRDERLKELEASGPTHLIQLKSTHYSLSASGAVVVLQETELKRLINDAQHDCCKCQDHLDLELKSHEDKVCCMNVSMEGKMREAEKKYQAQFDIAKRAFVDSEAVHERDLLVSKATERLI